jgi:hypothetical protein
MILCFLRGKTLRVMRLLALLEIFDTPEAYAIIETMASGHPDAQPTKVAQSMLSA